jgi:hypothetical protein
LKFPLKLKISMQAKLFLKDDYPATEDFIERLEDGELVA